MELSVRFFFQFDFDFVREVLTQPGIISTAMGGVGVVVRGRGRPSQKTLH